MNGLRRVLGDLVDDVDCTLFREDGVRWDGADGNFRWTAELSKVEFAQLPDCVSDFSAILGCTVALPFCVELFAFVALRPEDPIVQACHRKTSALELIATQFVSNTVKLMRWSIPRAYVAPKDVMLYVEGTLPVFERGGMGGGEVEVRKNCFQ